MSLLRNIASGIRSLFQRKRAERELDEELRGFMEMATEENMKQGRSQKDALRAVRLERGSLGAAKELVRSAGWESFLETSWQDFRYGLRQLRRNPGFTAVAVLTLALGIGANTAIFSTLNALVFRELPVPHPEQLVRFGAHTPGDDYASVSVPMFQEIMREQNVFSGAFAVEGGPLMNVEVNGELLRAKVDPVTGAYYSVLGAAPEIGRLIEPADVNLTSVEPAQVAVLGYAFWQRQYSGAKDVIGKRLKIENAPFTIIGVTRREFSGISADEEDDIVVPLTAEPMIYGSSNIQTSLERRDVLWLNPVGRLKPGVTVAQARAELDALWPAIRQAVAPTKQTPVERGIFDSLEFTVKSDATGGSYLRSQFAKPVYVLLGISAVVLLLACVNLASLMLSRAAARNHEFGVRATLGASRSRLAQQLIIESIMLSVAGSHRLFARELGKSWPDRFSFPPYRLVRLCRCESAQSFAGPAGPRFHSEHCNPDWRAFRPRARVARDSRKSQLCIAAKFTNSGPRNRNSRKKFDRHPSLPFSRLARRRRALHPHT
jgi:hypothetical protein